jgi:hypothetical protein
LEQGEGELAGKMGEKVSNVANPGGGDDQVGGMGRAKSEKTPRIWWDAENCRVLNYRGSRIKRLADEE